MAFLMALGITLSFGVRWATWASTWLFFPFADPEASALNMAIPPVLFILAAALVATRARPYPMNRVLVAIMAFVPLLLAAMWGVHVVNGAFVDSPTSSLAYRVVGLRHGRDGTTATLEQEAHAGATSMTVDADRFAHPLHEGDDVTIEIARGRLGYSFIRAYR